MSEQLDVEKQPSVGMPVDYAAILKKQAEELRSRLSAPSGDSIKVGTDKTFTLPNGTVVDHLQVVILDFISGNFYYPSTYNPKDITPPECFALGPAPSLLVPSANSPNKQAESCAVCPQNVWGSGSGNGKACRNHRLLAVAAPGGPAINGETGEMEDPQIMVLRISPTAIKNFDKYVLKVSQHFDSPPIGVISSIKFDPQYSYPVVAFERPAPNDDVGYYMSRQAEARDRLMTEPDVSKAGAPPLPLPTGKAKIRR